MIYFHFVGIHPTPRDSYLGWAESCDVRNNWPFWGPCSYDKMWQVSNYFRTFFSVFYASQIRATEPNIIYPDIATKAKTTYQMTNFTETTRKIWMKPNETETKLHKLFTISRSNSPVLRRERNLHVVKLLKLNDVKQSSKIWLMTCCALKSPINQRFYALIWNGYVFSLLENAGRTIFHLKVPRNKMKPFRVMLGLGA